MATTSRTPPVARGKSTAAVTPFEDSGLSKRMSVEKDVVDELLLVCGVIGSTTKDPSNDEQLVPVTDCLNWLQDLQRALRRDDDSYRPISLLIGKWKVVQQKLLPLVMSCRYDTPMVLTIVKILVILTKPLSENAKRAGRMVIDTKSRKFPPSVVKEQIKLRENAIAQSEILMEYKRAVAHHSSHLTPKKGDEQGGLLSVFVSLLAEPLSKTGTSRTDTDHLTIELVLHLFRNLLSAEPLLKGSPETSHRNIKLHQELISLFERELVLEIILVIAQEMELRENAPYNLLMMELLHHLLRNQDPTSVARSVKERSTKIVKGKENAARSGGGKKTVAYSSRSIANNGSDSLRAQLSREKQRFSGIATTRHSHFGGTLVSKRQGGKQQFRSAVLGNKQVAPPEAKKRKNRKSEPFIGSGKTLASHTRSSIATQESLTAARAQKSIHNFCCRFVKDCYGPVMKSLKNEFRRDSVRLEEGDKVVFFRIVWFFCQWWRVSGPGRKATDPSSENNAVPGPDDATNAVGQMIFTMDVFTFNLVLNAADTFLLHKKHSQLAQTVALYNEMMNMLLEMYRSSDSTENLMALGLLDRLFYGNEPLDRLPKLLSKWTPGSSTREYACDLVELCHVSLKLLELNAKACVEKPNESGKASNMDKKKKDAVSRMKEVASEFDLTSYMSRRIVSNHVVFLYTHLLSQYAVNAPSVNHRVIALLQRIRKMTIASKEETKNDEDDVDPAQLLLASKTVTLEPMLYHIQMFVVLEQILNDSSIRNDKDYVTTLSFASSVMSNFAAAAEKNPLLHVECLFRHPIPHRFCELSTNSYVNEELRMIAEREFLLDERRRLESDAHDSDNDGSPTDDAPGASSESGPSNAIEEETEWVDDMSNDETPAILSRLKKKKKKKKARRSKKRKAPVESSDNSSDDEEDSEGEKETRTPTKKRKTDVSDDSDDESESSSPGNELKSDVASSPSEKSSAENKSVDDKESEEGDDATNAKAEEEKPKHRFRKVVSENSSDDDDDVFGNKVEDEEPTAVKPFVFDDDSD